MISKFEHGWLVEQENLGKIFSGDAAGLEIVSEADAVKIITEAARNRPIYCNPVIFVIEYVFINTFLPSEGIAPDDATSGAFFMRRQTDIFMRVYFQNISITRGLTLAKSRSSSLYSNSVIGVPTTGSRSSSGIG